MTDATGSAGRAPAGLTPERVGFFTDAVFAIAMTLLVIEIPRPEGDADFAVGDGVTKAEAAGNLLRFLGDQAGSLIAYVLAFWVLWTVWRSHHALFDQIGRLSPAMVRWHFPLLLLIGFLPYPTTVLGHHTDNPVAAALYSIAVGSLMVCRSGIQSTALRDDLLIPYADRVDLRAHALSSWLIAGWWFLTLALAWWTPAVVWAWIATPWLGRLIYGRIRSRS